jgi:hypothetical protein
MKIVAKSGFNKIFILDTPARKGESRSGKELYEWLKNRVLIPNITCERIEISSKKRLIQVLNTIANETEQTDLVPLIHFEAHGSTKGMILKPGESIEWASLLNLTRRINIATRNNLTLSFAVCNAGFMYADIDIQKPAPFFGFVGSIQEIDFGAMEAGYNAFFDNILSDESLNKAIDALNRDYEHESLESGNMPVTTRMFDFQLAEKFFEDLWLSVFKGWLSKEGRNERIQHHMALALQNPATKYRYSIPALRYELEQINTEESRLELKREARALFMME